MEIEADDGRRIRLELFGENYYLSVFPGDGGWAFMPTVRRENDPMMSWVRLRGGERWLKKEKGRLKWNCTGQ